MLEHSRGPIAAVGGLCSGKGGSYVIANLSDLPRGQGMHRAHAGVRFRRISRTHVPWYHCLKSVAQSDGLLWCQPFVL